jgi:hypothetical protein
MKYNREIEQIIEKAAKRMCSKYNVSLLSGY